MDNKINVELLCNTYYGCPKQKGDILSVPEDVAKRWEHNKIAKLVNSQSKAKDIPNENAEDDLSKKTTKELYELCKEKGIEVETKRNKEYYLSALSEK